MALNLPLPYYPSASDAKISESDVLVYGNISLLSRVPAQTTSTGVIETLKSITITEYIVFGSTKRRCIVAIPTLDTDGNKITDQKARNLYVATKSHLGIFASVKAATKYLRLLSIRSGDVQKLLRSESGNVEVTNTTQYITTPFDTQLLPDQIKGAFKVGQVIQPPKLGDLISIPEIPDQASSDGSLSAIDTIRDSIFSIDVSYDISATTEVTLKIIDKDYFFLENNYFVLRRVIKYRGREYEVAVIDVDAGETGSPVLTVSLRSRAVQRMKRDKKAKNITGSNGYEFARSLAKTYGLNFFGEPNPVKTQSLVTARGKNSDDSVWTTLTRTASDGESVVFEIDGTLVYATEKFLMGKFGLYGELNKMYIPLPYLPDYIANSDSFKDSDFQKAREEFPLIKWHAYRSSENDPIEADGSCQIARPNGALLRPGHTVLTGPLPTFFSGLYLCSQVSFSEGTNEPVNISFKSPTKPSSQENIPLSGIRPGTNSFSRFKIKSTRSGTTVVPPPPPAPINLGPR